MGTLAGICFDGKARSPWKQTLIIAGIDENTSRNFGAETRKSHV